MTTEPRDLRVGDLMTADLVAAKPDDQIGRVRQQLTHLPIGAVPVLDEDDHPVGIVTLADLQEVAYESEPIAPCMSRPVCTIDTTATVRAAAGRFLDERLHHLVVLDHHRAVGILTPFDLLELLAD